MYVDPAATEACKLFEYFLQLHKSHLRSYRFKSKSQILWRISPQRRSFLVEVIASDVWVGRGVLMVFLHVHLLQRSLEVCTKEMLQINMLLTRSDS